MLFTFNMPWLWLPVTLFAAMVPVICILNAVRLHRSLMIPEEEREEDRVSCLGGWSGAAIIAGVVSAFTLPLDLVWLCIPIAVLILLAYLPIFAMIERRVNERANKSDEQVLTVTDRDG